MKIIKAAAVLLLSLTMLLCIPSEITYALSTQTTKSASAEKSDGKIKVSQKSVTVEEGQSVKITVYTGGKNVKFKRSSKDAVCKAGKVKNGKFTLTITGAKEGSCTVTLYDKSNTSDICKIKVTVKEETYYTFRTEKLFDSHFKKHGDEFGDITAEEYLDKANALIDDTSEDVLTKSSEDGDMLFFNKETGEFLVLSEDGYIRTFFIPDDGIEYWERQ